MTMSLEDAGVQWDDNFWRAVSSGSGRLPESEAEAKRMLKEIQKGGLVALTELDLADGVGELGHGFLRMLQDFRTDLATAASRFAAVAERAVGCNFPGGSWSLSMRDNEDVDDIEAWWFAVERDARWWSPPRYLDVDGDSKPE